MTEPSAAQSPLRDPRLTERPTRSFPGFAAVVDAATKSSLAVRGSYQPDVADELLAPLARAVGTVVLLGFTGGIQWSAFASSDEAKDGQADPLDRWSRRTIDGIAHGFGATTAYPSGHPRLPFQRIAARCEPVSPSPLGLLIHPTWGLWHAYRGLLLFAERIDLPPSKVQQSPCSVCSAKPCLTACPVDAFASGTYDLAACRGHVESADGAACRELGCLARRACPVGPEFRYGESQARFHMDSFRRSVAG